MNDFLPKDYKLPVTSNYMKFQAEQNRFRILSKPIIGWEYWIEEAGKRNPRRVKKFTEIPTRIQNQTGQDKPKHFWAMVVWNYLDNKIQILEITQKSIMKAIESLVQDSDWESPLNYDLVVKKEGDGLETEYQINPKPKESVDPEIVEIYKSTNVNLEALYSGNDPFETQEIRENIEEEEVNIDDLPI